jgi:hypothetical protein
MTKHELFIKVKNHLLTQNKKAYVDLDINGSCALRGMDNTKCAVGCLIPDELYNPDMEHQMWTDPFDDLICNYYGLNKKEYYDVMGPMRTIHDYRKVEYWKEEIDNLEIELFEKGQVLVID